MFKFKSPWFDEVTMDAALVTDNYVDNDRLYIGMACYETEWGGYWEPYADITVNLPSEPLSGKNCAFVDSNNCPWAMKMIREQGLGKPTGMMGFSGWCAYPEVEFDMDAINSHLLREKR